jgi:chemotaxis protein methyltransferase CheR
MVKKITSDEMTLLGKLILDKSGIVLDNSKAYLFESRLSPLLKEMALDNYKQLYDNAVRDNSKRIITQIIDAVCTNETYFFRDTSPFNLFIQKLVPDFYESSPNGILKVWSAAASTGQEVYSLIMALKEAGISNTTYKMRFLATDISDTAIAKGSSGIYTDFEVGRGVDATKQKKYFTQHEKGWKIKDEIRAQVQFRKTHLLDPVGLRMLGKHDIIFCRNVAIYFSQEDRKKLFDTLASMLNPNGILVIGATESLINITDSFQKEIFQGITYYKPK